MTKAEEVAKLSLTTPLTMADIEQKGGVWDGSNFIFEDGSKGAFTKHAAVKTEHGMQVFSHYRFEVIDE